ncbi:MAG: DUF1064 domain-containing protein [Hyphomonadaceae bacterium]
MARHKYGAKAVVIDGRRFASTAEGNRYLELKILQRARRIAGLECQVRFDLHAAGGKKVATFVADFVYTRDGERVVEDVKGYLTDMYRLKRRWMLAEYGIAIEEIGGQKKARKATAKRARGAAR